MLNRDRLDQINRALPGKLSHCATLVAGGQCAWDCCVYTTSYCLLFPGEYEAALALGFHFDGYDFLDRDYHGGMKVVPTSKGCCADPVLGENAYKSIDCKLYPLWPELHDEEVVLISGDLCPIIKGGLPLRQHAANVAEAARVLLGDDDIRTFLQHARMVGYSVHQRLGDLHGFLEGNAPTEQAT